MKKLLFIIVALMVGVTASAKKAEYDMATALRLAETKGGHLTSTNAEGVTTYFDPRTEMYITYDNFVKYYSYKSLRLIEEFELHRKAKLVAEEKVVGMSKFEVVKYRTLNHCLGTKTPVWRWTNGTNREIYDIETNRYISESAYNVKYGADAVRQIMNVEKIANGEKATYKQIKSLLYPSADNSYKGFRWKMKPVNAVVGGSLIGLSVAAYCISHSAIDSSIDNIDPKLRADEILDKTNSLRKTQRTVGYICAGVSVAGVIVLLTGLHKEYANGVTLGDNLYLRDNGAGLSLTKKF